MLKIKNIFSIKQVKKLEDEIATLKEKILIKENENVTLREVLKNSSCSSLLLEENRTLIRWIHEILEQFGTMDVYDRKSINIPVYRKLEPDIFSSNYEWKRTQVETIVIPEIVIRNMK